MAVGLVERASLAYAPFSDGGSSEQAKIVITLGRGTRESSGSAAYTDVMYDQK